MSRIPTHTIDDAPPASRALLANVIQFSPTGKPLNMHAQMAHSPAVLVSYASLRSATAEHGTLEQPLRAALMLAAATATTNDYVVAVTTQLTRVMGWTDEQVAALRAGQPVGDDKTDALTRLVREAAAHAGRVTDATWSNAQGAGWNDEQLAEAFAYLGLTLFTAYFLNYARTDLDIPAVGDGTH